MAETLNYDFMDTDAWIEKRQGMTISEIFKLMGEEYFRDLETKVLRELLEEDNEYVISVGGGMPLREENRRILRKLGKVIYLNATPETIYDRIKGDTARPLLQTANPKARIKEMLGDREEKYLAAAHEIVSVDGKEVSKVLDELMKIIKES